MPSRLQTLAGQRIGVVLSAGYFGFFGHAGFMAALHSRGLRASVLGGTSAGGMIAAFVAAGVPDERIHELLLSLKRADFWDPAVTPAVSALTRRKGHLTGLLKGERFESLLRTLLPVHDFAALKTPLLTVATNLTTHAPERIWQGDLPSAVLATCAYPGLFQAVRRGDSLLWDGGIVDKAPAVAVAEHFAGQFDTLLVHHLPSHDAREEPRGVTAYAAGIAAGMSALRHEHFQLQLELLKARQVRTWAFSQRLPAVSPRQLQVGAQAWQLAKAQTLAWLDEPEA